MESMRVKRDRSHLTLLHGGEATGAPAVPSAFAARAIRPRLELVTPAAAEPLSPAAQSLLAWLDANTYAATPDLAVREDLDLLRADVAARLALDARVAARGRPRAGEAS